MKKVMVSLLAALMLTGCAAQQAAPTSTPTTAPTTAPTAETTAAPEQTVPETTAPVAPATPISADQLADGSYEITVESSSSMFNIVKCVLVVEDGSMHATMTMSGKGYGKLFMGTGEEALAASEDDYIPVAEDEDGMKQFTVPVEALDMPIDCAAWSIKKETWYDRTLVFQSAQLPDEARKAG